MANKAILDRLIANAKRHFAIPNHEGEVADFKARQEWFPSTLKEGRQWRSPLGGVAKPSEESNPRKKIKIPNAGDRWW